MSLNRRGFIAGLMTCPICAGLAMAEGAPKWVYEGKDGAADWASSKRNSKPAPSDRNNRRSI